MSILLSTSELSKHFAGVRALDKVDISIEKGTIHGLIGPNGSGKTTFFNVVTGLLPATEGKVYLNSKDITNLSPNIIAKKGISRTLLKTIGGDKQCAISLNKVRVPGQNVLGHVDQGWTYIKKVLQRAAVLTTTPFRKNPC